MPHSEIDSIGDFLRKQYEKFAIVGIFGTVSVFLTSNFPGDNQLIANLGIVASLSIFTLTSLWLGRESLNELLRNRGEVDLSTEIGYLVLASATTILGATVFFSIISYPRAMELLSKTLLVGIGLLIYARVFNSERYESERLSRGSTALISGYAVFAIYESYSTGISFIADQASFPWMIEIPLFLACLGVTHLAFCEAFSAIYRFAESETFGDVLADYSPFILLSTVSLSITLNHWSPQTPNGYIAIFGWYWESFVALYWVATSGIIVYLSLKAPESAVARKFAPTIGKVGALVAWVVVLSLLIGYSLGFIGEVIVPM